jgi:hydrogenase maturation protein HypF
VTLVAGPRVATHLRIRGVVQGVGFRPLVFRLASTHRLTGWVRNGNDGVEIHVEGETTDIAAFVHELETHPPAAARVTAVEIAPATPLNLDRFEIHHRDRSHPPATRVSPDLPLCPACRRELLDARDRRAGYPYVNCTACGPRYSIIRALPYDRAQTTMAPWPMCPACEAEYRDVGDRRFHAQPTACPECGPRYVLRISPKAHLCSVFVEAGLQAGVETGQVDLKVGLYTNKRVPVQFTSPVPVPRARST